MSEAPGARQDEAPDFPPDVLPRRLQLSRSLKFDLQRISKSLNGLAAIRIDRKSGWENPFLDGTDSIEMFRRWLKGEMPAEELVRYSGRGRLSSCGWLTNRRQKLLNAMPSLRGKNIACWCKLCDPCHGDVLLEMANSPCAPLRSE
jgi:hypothetical protein